MRMKKLIFLAGAVALLVAAPAPARTAKTLAVDISKAGFVPASPSIQVGDSITWTNKDTATHQVVCANCPFTSPVLATGQTFTFTFTKAGTFATALTNQKVDILAQACGETASKVVGTVMTATGGAFTFQTKPPLNTSY